MVGGGVCLERQPTKQRVHECGGGCSLVSSRTGRHALTTQVYNGPVYW